MTFRIDASGLTYNLLAQENTEILEGVLPLRIRKRLQKDPHTYCMLAYDDKKYYGLCIFYHIRQALFIEKFYIAPQVRRQGIGEQLLEAVLSVNATNGSRIAQTRVPDSLHKELMPFFEKAGFEAEGVQQITRFSLKSLANNPDFLYLLQGLERRNKMAPASIFIEEGVLRLEQADTGELMRYGQELSDDGNYYHFFSPSVDRYCSSVYLKDGKIIACFLIGREDEELTIEYVNTQKSGPIALVKMLAQSYHNTIERYGENATVCVLTINDDSRSMVEKLVLDPTEQEKVWIMECLLQATDDMDSNIGDNADDIENME